MRGKRPYHLELLILSLASWLLIFSPAVTEAGHDEEYIDMIPAERIKRLVDNGEKIFFIDLRPLNEFQKSRIAGARSIPVGELQKRYNEIPKSGRVILYCSCPPGGDDESYSYLTLRGKGYRNVSVMEEGLAGWTKRRLPVEKSPP